MRRILKRDWDRLHGLAVDIVNASSRDDSPSSRRLHREMLALLDELDARYGPHPALFSTRGDYVYPRRKRIEWFERAFRLARKLDEHQDAWLAAGSLVQEAIWSRDDASARKWLRAMRGVLKTSPDRDGEDEAERLALDVAARAKTRRKLRAL